jgi:tetratricopeptide (TPR) repeat protein
MIINRIKSLSKFHKVSILVLLLTSFILYFKALDGAFLMSWDDNQQIVENEDVTHLNFNSVKNYFSTYYVGSYQPIASLSFGMEYAIFGPNPKAYHLTNLVLHIINVLLVFFFLLALFKDQMLALVVAMLFAIHPYQTEVVAWISTRSTLLYSTFLLIALNIFTRQVERKEKDFKTYSFAFIFFALACFTKSAAIVFPFVLIAVRTFIEKKIDFKKILYLIPYFALSVVIGLASIQSRKSGGSTFENFYNLYSIKQHVVLRLETLYFYLVEPFYQTKLHIWRCFPMISDGNGGIAIPSYFNTHSVLALIVLGILAILAIKYRKGTYGSMIFFALAFFLINIGLHMNFFAVSNNMVAERYLYLPSIALGLILYTLIAWLGKQAPGLQLKKFQWFIWVPLFFFYGSTTHGQIKHWKNDQALYSQDVKYTQYYYSFDQLGKIYHRKGFIEASVETFNDFVKINPMEPRIYLQRALVIYDLGDFDYALKDLNRVLDLRHTEKKQDLDEKMIAHALNNMGIIWQNKDPQKSIRYFDSAFNQGHIEALTHKQLVMNSIRTPMPSEQGGDITFPTPTPGPVLDEEGSVFELVPKFLATKEYDKALGYVEFMNYIAADSSITYEYRAKALIGLKRYEEALITLNEAIESKELKTGELYYLRGLSFEFLEKKEQSCKDFLNASGSHNHQKAKVKLVKCQ